jgi:hypothetical protein
VLEQLPERLSSKIAVDPSGCWLWTASLRGGYGQVRFGPSTRAAHVVVFEQLVGAVPDGMELDHLCRIRHCVNPDHVEPVTHRENVLRGEGPAAVNARKTHCDRGHDLADGYRYDTGRMCRQCALDRAAEQRRFLGAVHGPPVNRAARRFAERAKQRQDLDRLGPVHGPAVSRVARRRANRLSALDRIGPVHGPQLQALRVLDVVEDVVVLPDPIEDVVAAARQRRQSTLAWFVMKKAAS